MTLDSLPFEARMSLRLAAIAFRAYSTAEYDEKLRKEYRYSRDNGLFVIRANLHGLGRVDYVVAGRDEGQRSVLAVMRVRDVGGWSIHNVTWGEIGIGAPHDSASVWIMRGEKQHPNGQWDAVLVKRLYAPRAAPEIYYWDAERRRFFVRARGRAD